MADGVTPFPIAGKSLELSHMWGVCRAKRTDVLVTMIPNEAGAAGVTMPGLPGHGACSRRVARRNSGVPT